MTRPQFYRIVSIAATVGILTAAVCLSGGCIYLFCTQGGYSREHVAMVFRAVSLPVYLGLGLAALGAVLEACRQRKRRRITAAKQDFVILRRLRKAVKPCNCSKKLWQEILAERRSQRRRQAILLVPAVLTWASLFLYLLGGDRFSQEDINGTVLGCVGALLPGLALWLGWTLAVSHKNQESCRREIALLKQAAPSEKVASVGSSSAFVPLLRFSLLALAVFLVVWGLYLGGAADVLTKAINICTECIGLG